MITAGDRIYKLAIAGGTINVNDTQYTAGDAQGDLVQLLAGWTALNSATLKSLIVLDSSAQAAAFDVIFFDSNPSASAFSDNASAGIAAGDLAKVLGIVEVEAADYVAISNLAVGNVSIATIKPDLPILPAAGGTIYMACISRGTPTYTADSLAITLVVQFNNDAAAPTPA